VGTRTAAIHHEDGPAFEFKDEQEALGALNDQEVDRAGSRCWGGAQMTGKGAEQEPPAGIPQTRGR
jgi:hypothetical protein